MPIKKSIEKLELTNYRLYVFISFIVGAVVFLLTFFVTHQIMDGEMGNGFMYQKNRADEILTISNVNEIGFDVEINSSEEVKVTYFFGKTPETLIMFFEPRDFVKEETQQFRNIVPDTQNYVQIEIETKDGEKIKSRVINVNDMIK